MQKEIYDYLNELFAPYEKEYEVEDIKEEMYAGMVEYYEDYYLSGKTDDEIFKLVKDKIGNIDTMISELVSSGYLKSKDIVDVLLEEKEFLEVNKIDLKVINANIVIKNYDGLNVKFETEEKNAVYKSRLDNGCLYFKEQKESVFNFIKKVHKSQITILIPNNLIIDYKLENVNGNINIEVSEFSESDIKSVHGNIFITANGEYLSVKGVDNDIYLASNISDVLLKSVNGKIDISKEISSLSCSSVTGSIKALIGNDSDDIVLKTVSGNIRVASNNLDLSKIVIPSKVFGSKISEDIEGIDKTISIKLESTLGNVIIN